MRLSPLSGSGTVLVERYRLEERLSGPDPVQGSLWRAVDVMAGDVPVAIRQLETTAAQQRLQLRPEPLNTLLGFWSHQVTDGHRQIASHHIHRTP